MVKNQVSRSTRDQLQGIMIRLLLGLLFFSTISLSTLFTVPASAMQLQLDSGMTTAVSGMKTVTVTFQVYAKQAGTDVDLMNSITVKKTGESGFSPLGTNDTVTNSTYSASSSTLEINFHDALAGAANSIQIAAGAFMNSNGALYNQTILIENIDVAPPQVVGSSSDQGNYVYLYFNEEFTLNTDADQNAYLRSKMSIATDGVNFVPLPEEIKVQKYSNQIYLYNDYNDRKVILGTNTRIKIASDTLKDATGNLNAEMNLDITPPVIQSAAISNVNKTVTITFNESVIDNIANCECYPLLIQNITILKNGNFKSLFDANGDGVDDGNTASIVNGELVINFAQALVGTNNQIAINGGALKDSAGNVDYSNKITPFIQAGGAADTTAPKLLNHYVSSDKLALTFVFDENVENNPATGPNFMSKIYNGYYGGSYGVAGVELLANTVILHFNETFNVYYFRLNSNSLQDSAGNIVSNHIYTDWIDTGNPLNNNNNSISHNGRWLNLGFNYNLADNTIVSGVSSLKNKIKVSTDGVNFLPLVAEDVVTIQESRLVVLFHDSKKSGTIQVKVEAGALKELHFPSQTNAAIDTVIAYNTPDVKGYFFSNAASEFVFEDDGVWSTKVRDVIVYDDTGVERRLTSSEYTLIAGKLTINQGVFQEGHEYYLYIEADGYSSKEVEGEAFTSSKLFYMTAPVVSNQGGIHASVNIFRDDDIWIDWESGSTQTVVFELFNGTTPVSIVASELDIYTGTYSAQFNVVDAATNLNYTVKAYVVNKFSNDYTNVGMNMTTQVTQAEYDLMLNNQNGGGGEPS